MYSYVRSYCMLLLIMQVRQAYRQALRMLCDNFVAMEYDIAVLGVLHHSGTRLNCNRSRRILFRDLFRYSSRPIALWFG